LNNNKTTDHSIPRCDLIKYLAKAIDIPQYVNDNVFVDVEELILEDINNNKNYTKMTLKVIKKNVLTTILIQHFIALLK
jgi:hypothetical protein